MLACALVRRGLGLRSRHLRVHLADAPAHDAEAWTVAESGGEQAAAQLLLSMLRALTLQDGRAHTWSQVLTNARHAWLTGAPLHTL
jgi:hypothetical protein